MRVAPGLIARTLLVATLMVLVACGDAARPATDVTSPPPVAPSSSVITPSSEEPSTTAVVPSTPAVRTVELSAIGGQAPEGPGLVRVALGEAVRLLVTADTADEVHLHTYDLRAAVGPGQVGQIDFVATIGGRHELELEARHSLLATIEVR
ncbi:MAG: hypothetical protein ACT4OS_08925 [Acidimicrobiales bacterium]